MFSALLRSAQQLVAGGVFLNSGAIRQNAAGLMSLPAKSPSRPAHSRVGRWLEPFAASLWVLFIFWTLAMVVVWLGGWGDAELQQWVKNPDLRGALLWMFNGMDSGWILLAAANAHFALTSTDGLARARRRALLTLGSAWLVAACSVWSGLPLGAVRYTERLGIHLGPVSLGTPFLWFVIIAGAAATAAWMLPRASHVQLCLATGFLSAASSVNLEPIGWKLRAWWLWYPTDLAPRSWPPVSAYVTWFFVAAVLAFAQHERDVVRGAMKPPARLLAIFLLVNAVFLIGHLKQVT